MTLLNESGKGGTRAPSILFIPISGELGSGEYYRLLAIAKACYAQHPDWQYEFFLNTTARVEEPEFCLFHRIPGSPKKNQEIVTETIRKRRPDIVIFDSVIRKPMLQAAKESGARTVYVSWRDRTRRNGFHLKRMRYLDEHWIVASPEQQRLFVEERARLALTANRVRVSFFGAIASPPCQERQRHTLAELGLSEGPSYVLFCSGGGGTMIGQKEASEVFRDAARAFHESTGFPSLFISGPLSDVELSSGGNRVELRSVTPEIFTDLVAGASIMVSGGGSMIQQVLALGKPCVAAPTDASDQAPRVNRLHEQGVIIGVRAKKQAIAAAVEDLLGDAEKRQALVESAEAGNFTNGMQRILSGIEHMMATRH